MSAEPDGGEWTFTETAGLSFAEPHIVYLNGTWLLFETVTSPGFETVVYTADSPDEAWTERITISGWRAGVGSGAQRVVYGDGKYVVSSEQHATFLVIPDDFSTYSLESVPSSLGSYDIAYGDGYWVCTSPTLFSLPPRMYWATDIAGGWTQASSTDLQSLAPTTVAYNGERWVATGVGTTVITTTDPTGAWSTCTVNTTGLSGTGIVLQWLPEISEWVALWEAGSSIKPARWAPADASEWEPIGYNMNCYPQPEKPFAAGDGYIVQTGWGGATTQQTTYISASTFAATGSADILDASTNTYGVFHSIEYADGKFAMAGKPSTESTYGVVTSPYEEGGAGWGLVL